MSSDPNRDDIDYSDDTDGMDYAEGDGPEYNTGDDDDLVLPEPRRGNDPANFDRDDDDEPTDNDFDEPQTPEFDLDSALADLDGTDDDDDDLEDTEPEDLLPQAASNRLHAELRVTRRENREMREENRLLRERFDRFLSVLEQAGENVGEDGQPVHEEAVPDENEDPLGFQIYTQKKILEKLHALENNEAQKGQVDEAAAVFQRADAQTAQFVNTVGKEVYDGATQFLVKKLVYDRMADLGMSKADAINDAARWVLDRKLEWAQTGKNPGKMFFDKALREGYKAGGKRSGGQPSDVKADIARKRERAAKSPSISAAGPGKSAKKLTIDNALRMSENDWDRAVEEIAKDRGKKSRDLRMSDLIKPVR